MSTGAAGRGPERPRSGRDGQAPLQRLCAGDRQRSGPGLQAWLVRRRKIPQEPRCPPPLASASIRLRSSGLEHDEARLNRHCERSEAIQKPLKVWIASSLTLLAMTDTELINLKSSRSQLAFTDNELA